MKKLLLLLFLLTSFAIAQPQKTVAPPGMTAYLQRMEQEGFCGGVLVADKGHILLQEGYGMADPGSKRRQTAETVFSVGSVTKQFTAAAILKLEEEGLLQVTDPLKKFLKTAPPDKQEITIHQLLTHTAGFPEVLGDDYDTVSASLFLDQAMHAPLEYEPGTRYLYSNVGYSLLGILIERISGMGYEKYLREKLFLPAGMKQTGYLLPGFKKEMLATGYRNGKRWGTAMDKAWMHDGPGWHLRANGGVLSTTGDMYRWYRALQGYTVLMQAGVNKLFTPYVAEDASQRTYYGYGWVVQPVNGMQYTWHNGGNGVYNFYIGFDRSAGRCVIVSSNNNSKISDRIAMELFNRLPGVQLPVPGEFDYRHNPVTDSILIALDKGAAYFSAHDDAILKGAGFDFENDMVLLGAGEALEENRRWAEAVALYETYTRLFPRIVVAWNRLGKSYAQLGEKEKARACWTKSVALRSVNNPAVQWLEESK